MFCFSIMTTSFINFVVSFQTLLRKLAISGNNSVTSYLPLVELLEGPAGASLSALPTVLMLEKKNVTGVVTVSCRTLNQLTASFQFGKSGVALGRKWPSKHLTFMGADGTYMYRSMKSLKKFLKRAGILSLRTIYMNPHISETAWHRKK